MTVTRTTNPFVWNRPIADPVSVIGMDQFALNVALELKGQTNVLMFGPRGTGKSSFLTRLDAELRRDHGPDAPGMEVICIDLQTAFSPSALCPVCMMLLSVIPNSQSRAELALKS